MSVAVATKWWYHVYYWTEDWEELDEVCMEDATFPEMLMAIASFQALRNVPRSQLQEHQRWVYDVGHLTVEVTLEEER